MIDQLPPDATLGGLALAAAVLYAAWQEYAAKNARDARLLATVGAASLAGSLAVWMQA